MSFLRIYTDQSPCAPPKARNHPLKARFLVPTLVWMALPICAGVKTISLVIDVHIGPPVLPVHTHNHLNQCQCEGLLSRSECRSRATQAEFTVTPRFLGCSVARLHSSPYFNRSRARSNRLSYIPHTHSLTHPLTHSNSQSSDL
jgi:hypothetical protein